MRWVQHSDEDLPKGSEAWRFFPELSRDEGEPLVEKSYGDSFEATDLEAHLAARGVGHLVIAGAQGDACIRSTLHGAIAWGYDATLVADAHTTEDWSEYGAPPPEQVIAHTNLSWAFQRRPGPRGPGARHRGSRLRRAERLSPAVDDGAQALAFTHSALEPRSAQKRAAKPV